MSLQIHHQCDIVEHNLICRHSAIAVVGRQFAINHNDWNSATFHTSFTHCLQVNHLHSEIRRMAFLFAYVYMCVQG